jgi:hypothetical protein
MRRHLIATAIAASSCLLGAAGTDARSAALNETYHTTGLIGVAAGQAMRLSVANVAATSCRVQLRLLDPRGIIVQSGAFTITPGSSAAIQLKAARGGRARSDVVSLGGTCRALMVTVEVVDTASGRTVLVNEGGDTIG